MYCFLKMSRPARGAWVEIIHSRRYKLGKGRAPQGARGLKLLELRPMRQDVRRAPQGARGLKCVGSTMPPYLKKRRAPQGARGLK